MDKLPLNYVAFRMREFVGKKRWAHERVKETDSIRLKFNTTLSVLYTPDSGRRYSS